MFTAYKASGMLQAVCLDAKSWHTFGTGSPVRFSAETSYSAEFPAHAIEPRAAPLALLPHRSGPRFDSVSSYTVRWLVHEL